jgi:hypothetical protein
MVAAMDTIEAEEELKQPVSDGRLYELVLRATGDEELAASELYNRIKYRQMRNEKFEG